MQKHLERGDVLLRVHPEVVKTLKANNARWLNEMEEMASKTIIVKSDPSAASGAIRHPVEPNRSYQQSRLGISIRPVSLRTLFPAAP